MRRFSASLVFVALMIGAVTARTMVYISHADSREIYVLELNEKNGSVQLIEKIAVAGTVMPLAVSPDRKYLFASLRSEPFSVSSFAINPRNGKLTPVNTTPLADNMAYLSTDRSGRYLFAASYNGNKISVNAIEANGAVSEKPLQIISTGKNAHCVLPDYSNHFLFVSNLGDDRIEQFRFDEKNGRVSPQQPPFVAATKGAGPRHFVLHPNRRFLFAVNELDATVSGYVITAYGTLQVNGTNSIRPANAQEKPWASDIHLTPNGKFLYAAERSTSMLTAFRVAENNGKLTLIGSYPTEKQPRSFNISPDGRFLLAVGQKSDSLSIYRINQKNGTLKFYTKTDVGKNPNWIEIVRLSN